MSLEVNFKESILTVLSQYEVKQKTIILEEAQAIASIRQMLEEMNSLIKFRQELINIVNKLPGRFFSFLPFIIDLKKELRNVIVDPRYSLEILFTYEAANLREENLYLKTKLINLESQSQNNHMTQSVKDKDLYQKITALEKEYAQSNQLLRIENRGLSIQFQQEKSKNTDLQNTINNLQNQVVSAESKIGLLQKELAEKDAEIERLRVENAALKKGCKEIEMDSNRNGFW